MRAWPTISTRTRSLILAAVFCVHAPAGNSPPELQLFLTTKWPAVLCEEEHIVSGTDSTNHSSTSEAREEQQEEQMRLVSPWGAPFWLLRLIPRLKQRVDPAAATSARYIETNTEQLGGPQEGEEAGREEQQEHRRSSGIIGNARI